MHIGGFSVFSLPPDAPADFVARLVARLRKQPIDNPPWNYRLARQSLLRSKLAPAWEIVPDEDGDDHVLHHALPAPGGARELGELVSRLHSQPLDMARPLWEFHAIEGCANRRFVVYMKLHHALFDATTAMKAAYLLTAETPNVVVRAPWKSQRDARKEKTGETGREPKRKRDLDASVLSAFQERIRERLESYRSLSEFAQAMGRTINAAIGDKSGLVGPYTGPNCILNGPLTGRRCVATHAFELARVKAVAKASESTLNDVMLAVCAGALRRYLAEMNALPQQALTAGVPVGLKHGEGQRAGNRVSLLLGTLATDVRDPFKRLMAIKRSMQAGKKHLLAMSAPTVDLYSTALIVPAILGAVTGSVMANVAISNVPGPRTRLFVAGAPLAETYPMSVLTPYMALNITCISYHKGLYLGLMSCPDLVPNVHQLAAYVGDAFNELEAAVKRHVAPQTSAAGRSRPLKRPRPSRPVTRS
jgi:WS/DGAT/MGAT family acyltransferase